jgi:hypothetical protein
MFRTFQVRTLFRRVYQVTHFLSFYSLFMFPNYASMENRFIKKCFHEASRLKSVENRFIQKQFLLNRIGALMQIGK